MTDTERDPKLMTELIVDDFLRNNSEGVSGDPTKVKKFLISGKPYCRKRNVSTDKSLLFCWET